MDPKEAVIAALSRNLLATEDTEIDLDKSRHHRMGMRLRVGARNDNKDWTATA
jgi:hypothetical protein